MRGFSFGSCFADAQHVEPYANADQATVDDDGELADVFVHHAFEGSEYGLVRSGDLQFAAGDREDRGGCGYPAQCSLIALTNVTIPAEPARIAVASDSDPIAACRPVTVTNARQAAILGPIEPAGNCMTSRSSRSSV